MAMARTTIITCVTTGEPMFPPFLSDFAWSVVGTGRHQLKFGTMGVIMDANIWVGLVDGVYAGTGKPATSSAEQAGIMRKILESLSMDISILAEAREVLRLKGGDNVGFYALTTLKERMIMSNSKPLAGKTAVVTGAGRGIGRAIALGFAKAGANVAILARTESELMEVSGRITALDVRCHMGLVDLADPSATETACGALVSALGNVDILVNNAGADLELGQVADSDPEKWWRTIEINVRGTYLVTRFLLEHINDGGKIINMSSGMGLRAAARQSSYTVSKAGVQIFTECLANELWPRKIDVNNLIPGPVATDIFNRERRPERYTPEEVLEMFKDELPPGFPPQERIKHPDEVADLAVSMAAQPVGGSTGQTFSLARRPF